MTKIPVHSTFRWKPKTGRALRAKRIHRLLAAAIAIALTAWVTAQSANQPAGSSPAFPVHIQVDASKVTAPLKPIWRFFGADEPNYAYMKDGQKLIAELGALAPKQVYFRTHNLLVTGDGTPALKWGSTNAYTRGRAGQPDLRLDDRRSHLRHLPRSAA